jgi:serine/threonine-protein kinase
LEGLASEPSEQREPAEGLPIHLGKYELIKLIATGGMAEIYLARVSGLPGFEKIVVVKRILPQLATNQEFVQMFLDEARVAATLHHPNIVQMYDIGAVDGSYFISMEYLHGEDLRSIARAVRAKGQERVPLEHALGIVVGIAAGLHYAHEKVGFDGKALNIVHRDVTPQNIFVTYDGGVKLVDFGIAKASNRASETRYGSLKGKIPYMSPEQCRSEPLDRRSDIFSLGILMYELTTSMRLYRGSSEFEVLKMIVEGDVKRPTELRKEYPAPLEDILMKALAKRREDRYQTARELQADLEAYIRQERLVVSPIAMAGWMESLFGHKIEAWREAQREGRDLALHAADLKTAEDEDGFSVSEESVVSMKPKSEGTAGPRRGLWAAVGVALAAGGIAWYVLGSHHSAPAAAPVKPAAVQPAPSYGIVKVGSNPPGAVVFLDGKRWDQRTPATIDAVAAGVPHTVVVQLVGYKDGEQKFSVPAGDIQKLELALEKTEAPPAAETPPPAAETPPHPPKVKKPPHGVAKTTPKTTAGAVQGDGFLLIGTTPYCEVLIDGSPKGVTPLPPIKLSAGKHQITLVNSRFNINRQVTVDVPVGETVRKKFEFPVPQ